MVAPCDLYSHHLAPCRKAYTKRSSVAEQSAWSEPGWAVGFCRCVSGLLMSVFRSLTRSVMQRRLKIRDRKIVACGCIAAVAFLLFILSRSSASRIAVNLVGRTNDA